MVHPFAISSSFCFVLLLCVCAIPCHATNLAVLPFLARSRRSPARKLMLLLPFSATTHHGLLSGPPRMVVSWLLAWQQQPPARSFVLPQDLLSTS
jgi:hypothetical protein